MKRAAILLVLAIGCGDGAEMVGVTGSGGAGGSTGTGGTSIGGTGGVGGSGYGDITAADALMCEEWPLCPDGVVAFRPVGRDYTDQTNMNCGDRGVWTDNGAGDIVCRRGTAAPGATFSARPNAGSLCLLDCKSSEAGSCTRRTCGGCSDYRAKACGVPFVARCRAPVAASVCVDGSTAALNPSGFFFQCTGPMNGPESLAAAACPYPRD